MNDISYIKILTLLRIYQFFNIDRIYLSEILIFFISFFYDQRLCVVYIYSISGVFINVERKTFLFEIS